MKKISFEENRKLSNNRNPPYPLQQVKMLKPVLFIIILLSLLFIVDAGCSREEQKRPQPSAPVKTANVITLDAPISLSAVGTVEAYSTVKVTARVSGLVTGQFVQD